MEFRPTTRGGLQVEFHSSISRFRTGSSGWGTSSSVIGKLVPAMTAMLEVNTKHSTLFRTARLMRLILPRSRIGVAPNEMEQALRRVHALPSRCNCL